MVETTLVYGLSLMESYLIRLTRSWEEANSLSAIANLKFVEDLAHLWLQLVLLDFHFLLL